MFLKILFLKKIIFLIFMYPTSKYQKYFQKIYYFDIFLSKKYFKNNK